MIRTIFTLASFATVVFGGLAGNSAAIVGGVAGLSLVVLSCWLSARRGEWTR